MAQTYTVISRTTSPLTTQSVTALDHERAVSAAIAAQAGAAGAGATGTEYSVPQCVLVSASGPTGTYSALTQYTSPATGSTYSGANPEDAKGQHKTAKGPTGPGSNIQIMQAF